jgi:hypothetical protein
MTRHCRRMAGARHGMCELTRHGMCKLALKQIRRNISSLFTKCNKKSQHTANQKFLRKCVKVQIIWAVHLTAKPELLTSLWGTVWHHRQFGLSGFSYFSSSGDPVTHANNAFKSANNRRKLLHVFINMNSCNTAGGFQWNHIKTDPMNMPQQMRQSDSRV